MLIGQVIYHLYSFSYVWTLVRLCGMHGCYVDN